MGGPNCLEGEPERELGEYSVVNVQEVKNEDASAIPDQEGVCESVQT